MAQFNTSEGMKGFVKNLLKPKSKHDMSDVSEALSNGLGKKSPMYKNLKQQIAIKKVFNDGNSIVLMDDSLWEAKNEGGWNPEHGKYWASQQTVVVSMWDAATDGYLIENLKMNDKSRWTFKGYEGDKSK